MTALRARTSKLTAVPLAKPETLQGEAVHAVGAPFAVTSYLVMALPPSLDGGVQTIRTLPSPGVALTFWGALGTPATTEIVSVACGAGRCEASPAWLAVSVQLLVPGATPVT